MDLYLYLDELLFINAPLDISPTPLPSGPRVRHTEHKTMTALWASHILQGGRLGCQYSAVVNTTQGSEQSSSWGQQAQKTLWRKKLLTQSITVEKRTLMPILDTNGVFSSWKLPRLFQCPSCHSTSLHGPQAHRVEGLNSLALSPGTSFPIYTMWYFDMKGIF